MKCGIAFLFLLANAGTQAAEVSATLTEGKLGARVDSIAFPATLSKDLTSGLTNRFYARVSLMDAQRVVSQRAIEIAIRYDLWDEKFSVVSTLDGANSDSRTLVSVAEVNALLAALPLPKLFDAAALPGARPLVLRVEVLLNPIDGEKVRMIRKWVARNSTPGAGAEQGISMSNAIFNRIFEQYAHDSDIAAVWRLDLTSGPFRLDDLVHERR